MNSLLCSTFYFLLSIWTGGSQLSQEMSSSLQLHYTSLPGLDIWSVLASVSTKALLDQLVQLAWNELSHITNFCGGISQSVGISNIKVTKWIPIFLNKHKTFVFFFLDYYTDCRSLTSGHLTIRISMTVSDGLRPKFKQDESQCNTVHCAVLFLKQEYDKLQWTKCMFSN